MTYGLILMGIGVLLAAASPIRLHMAHRRHSGSSAPCGALEPDALGR